jgi:hypothetical protein
MATGHSILLGIWRVGAVRRVNISLIFGNLSFASFPICKITPLNNRTAETLPCCKGIPCKALTRCSVPIRWIELRATRSGPRQGCAVQRSPGALGLMRGWRFWWGDAATAGCWHLEHGQLVEDPRPMR